MGVFLEFGAAQAVGENVGAGTDAGVGADIGVGVGAGAGACLVGPIPQVDGSSRQICARAGSERGLAQLVGAGDRWGFAHWVVHVVGVGVGVVEKAAVGRDGH